MKVFWLIIIFLFAVFIGPVLLIWALNTLGITDNTPLNFWTWLAGFILNGIFSGNSAKVFQDQKP